jgi:hypothetical protein
MPATQWRHLSAYVHVCVALAGGSATAMHVRTDRRLLARAADGAALYEVRERGPEGGGALSYRLEGKRSGDAAVFLVSSNFSPGDGSRPQRVSARDCEQRIAALGSELARRKIPGVTVRPERCRQASRDGLVAVRGP